MSSHELKSIDSNNLDEQPRFALDHIALCSFVFLVTFGLVAFELFVIYFQYGTIRPIWAYILWGSIAAILVVYAVLSLVHLAKSNWRVNSDKKKTFSLHGIVMLSLYLIFFGVYNVLPFKNQSDFSVLVHLLAGMVIGVSIGALVVAVVSFYVGPLTRKERGTAE